MTKTVTSLDAGYEYEVARLHADPKFMERPKKTGFGATALDPFGYTAERRHERALRANIATSSRASPASSARQERSGGEIA